MSPSPPFSRIIYSWTRGDARGFRRFECHGDRSGRWEALSFVAPSARRSQRSHWTFDMEAAASEKLFLQASALAGEFLGASASHRWLDQAGRESESVWLLHDQGVFAIPGSRPEARRFLAFLEQWPWSQDGPHQFFARLRIEQSAFASAPTPQPRPFERARSAPTQHIPEEASPAPELASEEGGADEAGEAAAGKGADLAQRWIERSGYIRRGTKSWQTAIRGSGLFEGAVIEAETVVHESQERLDPEQVEGVFSKLDKLYKALERFEAGEMEAPAGESQAQWYAFHGFWDSPRYFPQSSPEFKQIAALLSPLTNNNAAVQAFFTKI